MSFFTDVDEMGIVEQTINRVTRLEESESKKLLRRFKEIRQDLRDRLDILPSDRFSAQQLRGTLVQVDAAIGAINQSLKQGMGESSLKMAIEGNEDLIKEINKFSEEFQGAVVPLNINAFLIGQETSNFLINRYNASIDAYSEDLRGQLARNLTDLSIQQVSTDTMVRKMGQFFIGEEWKLRRIARTELHNTYNVGKMNGMKATRGTVLPDLKKTLFHPMDSRTANDSISLDNLHPVVDIDKPFRFSWKGRLRVFMAPPDRPNDRAILVPYREAWDQ